MNSPAPRHGPGRPLADPASVLPSTVLPIILHKAGLHTRLVCRTYRAHYPLHALAPHGLTTPTQLQAALTTLPTALTCLDLRAIPGPPHVEGRPICPAALQAIPAALPMLQQLLLPSIPQASTPSILHLLQACPHLHTLTVTWVVDELHPAPTRPSWAPVLHPPLATRLRSVSIPVDALASLPAAPPTPTFPHLTHLALLNSPNPLHATHLAPLPPAAPALASLTLACAWAHGRLPDIAHSLAALTALNSLTIQDLAITTYPAPMGALLQHMGALTTLRSLDLELDHTGWTPAEAGWLSRLTRLTDLRLQFAFTADWEDSEDEDVDDHEAAASIAPISTDVAAAVARLPLLHTLHYAMLKPCVVCKPSPPSWLACGQPGSFLRGLAAATQLRDLQLDSVTFVQEEAGVLGALQGLTSLRLANCRVDFWHPEGVSGLRWVAELPLLQQLGWHHHHCQPPCSYEQPPWDALAAALPRLHTLAVSSTMFGYAPAAGVVRLLAAVGGRLERLQLGRVQLAAINDGLQGLLGRMGCLRELCLHDDRMWGVGDVLPLLQYVGVPGSLRVCYVPHSRAADAELAALRAAFPLVAFRPHAALDGWFENVF